MYIEHIAIWTKNIRRLTDFYTLYFRGTPGPRYENAAKGFQSYFLSFEQGARLEIMQKDSIPDSRNDPQAQFTGFIHLSFVVGSEVEVDQLTDRLQADGYPVMSAPRRTGDGYYESSVLDPDGNWVEILASPTPAYTT